MQEEYTFQNVKKVVFGSNYLFKMRKIIVNSLVTSITSQLKGTGTVPPEELA